MMRISSNIKNKLKLSKRSFALAAMIFVCFRGATVEAEEQNYPKVYESQGAVDQHTGKPVEGKPKPQKQPVAVPAPYEGSSTPDAQAINPETQSQGNNPNRSGQPIPRPTPSPEAPPPPQTQDNPPPTPTSPIIEAPAPVQRVVPDSSKSTDQRSYESSMQTRLDAKVKKIEELKSAYESMNDKTKEEFLRLLRLAEGNRAAARIKLNQMKYVAPADWRTLVRGIDQAFIDLDAAIVRANEWLAARDRNK